MARNRKSPGSGRHQGMMATKPTVYTLFARIIESAFTGGMLWIAFFCGLLLVYMHVNQMAIANVLALLIFGLVIVSLLRGMKAWQSDNEDYLRSLTEYRMNMDDQRKRATVKKNIIWDRK